MSERKDTCHTCHFAGPPFNYEDHKCLRHAPEVRTVESHVDLRRHVPVWPIVRSGDWCGDYQRAAAEIGKTKS